MKSTLLRVLLLPLCVVSAFAQGVTIPPPPNNGFPAGETTVTLYEQWGIRSLSPARVSIPLGDSLQVQAQGPNIIAGKSVQWYKNNQPIPGATHTTLNLSRVGSSDAGWYWPAVVGTVPAYAPATQLLNLAVGPLSRFVNISMRADLAAGEGKVFITGFVVSGTEKKILIRAVGPSLAPFNVPNPLARPVLRIFDGDGKPYENQYVYPAVVGGPTYETDLAAALAKVGAFPTLPNSTDVVLLRPMSTGAYTAQVTSADGTAGTVLLEVYEVP